MRNVSVKNLTRRPAPRFAYAKIVGVVLPGWEISLVFATSAQAKALNKKLRHKSYVPNVLSYEAGAKNGEVIICLEEAGRQAPSYAMHPRQFTLYLFIHGLLHLKGWAHGGTMERRERNLVAKFATRDERSLPHVTTHRHRHRHRHVPGQTGRRRGTR